MRPARLLLLVAVLALALFIQGCAPKKDSSESPAAGIDVLLGTAPVTLNPYSPVIAARQVGELVFRGLTATTASGTVIPDLLAELPTKANGGISRDGRTITYRLAPGARWHDGTALTSADVVFTARLLEDGVMRDEPAAETAMITSITAPDASAVVVRLARPSAPFVWRWMPYVLPSHLLGRSADVLSDPYWQKPVGSGSYAVESAERRTTVVLRPQNPEQPQLRVHFTPDQSTARALWDQSQRAVWIGTPVGSASPEESYDETASNVWRGMFFNLAQTHPTADPSVRRAVSNATTIAPPASPAGAATDPSDASPLNDGDRERAKRISPKRLLAAAGWRPRRDGVMAKSGTSLRLLLILTELGSTEGDRIIAVRDGWSKQLKARASFAIDGREAFADGYIHGGRLWKGRYELARFDLPVDAYGWAWPFAADNTPSAARPFGLNVSRVRDSRLTSMYRAMLNAGDPETLREATKAAWLHADALDVAIWEGQVPSTVLSKGVVGVRAEPLPVNALAHATGWRVGSGSR